MSDTIFYKKIETGKGHAHPKLTLAEAREAMREKLRRASDAFIGPVLPKPTHAEGVVRGAIVLNEYKEMREAMKDSPAFAQAFSDFEQKRGFWANSSLEWPEETETREALATGRAISVPLLQRATDGEQRLLELKRTKPTLAEAREAMRVKLDERAAQNTLTPDRASSVRPSTRQPSLGL